jgi:hypothetical protein
MVPNIPALRFLRREGLQAPPRHPLGPEAIIFQSTLSPRHNSVSHHKVIVHQLKASGSLAPCLQAGVRLSSPVAAFGPFHPNPAELLIHHKVVVHPPKASVSLAPFLHGGVRLSSLRAPLIPIPLSSSSPRSMRKTSPSTKFARPALVQALTPTNSLSHGTGPPTS